MSDNKNWDAELAKIDKQLASISDDQLLAEKRAATVKPGAAPAAGAPARPAALPASTSAAPGVAKPVGTWKGWVQTAIAVGAAVGLLFWPYPQNCGLPLYGFVAAAGATSMLGAWSALGTWRHRLGLAHLASLLVVAWGIALGAREVLPRVGYAIPDAVRGATLECTAPAAPIPSTTIPGATVPPGTPGA